MCAWTNQFLWLNQSGSYKCAQRKFKCWNKVIQGVVIWVLSFRRSHAFPFPVWRIGFCTPLTSECNLRRAGPALWFSLHVAGRENTFLWLMTPTKNNGSSFPVISLNLRVDIFVSKVCLATCCRKSFQVDCAVPYSSHTPGYKHMTCEQLGIMAG